MPCSHRPARVTFYYSFSSYSNEKPNDFGFFRYFVSVDGGTYVRDLKRQPFAVLTYTSS